MLITLGWPLTSCVLSPPEIVLILFFHLVLQKLARFSEGPYMVCGWCPALIMCLN